MKISISIIIENAKLYYLEMGPYIVFMTIIAIIAILGVNRNAARIVAYVRVIEVIIVAFLASVVGIFIYLSKIPVF